MDPLFACRRSTRCGGRYMSGAVTFHLWYICRIRSRRPATRMRAVRAKEKGRGRWVNCSGGNGRVPGRAYWVSSHAIIPRARATTGLAYWPRSQLIYRSTEEPRKEKISFSVGYGYLMIRSSCHHGIVSPLRALTFADSPSCALACPRG